MTLFLYFNIFPFQNIAMRNRVLFFVTILCLAANFLLAQSKIKAIKAGKLIDVVNGVVLNNQTILISNDTIVAVGSSVTIPQGAEIIDLSNSTVLPGLIDCHTHITGQPGDDYYADIFR